MPVEFVGNNKKIFFKTDFIESRYKLARSLSKDIPAYDFSKISGKYVDIIALMKEFNAADNKEIAQTKDVIKNSKNVQKDSFIALKDTINSLPDNEITKKDDTIKVVLHKKDVKNYLKEYSKYLNRDFKTKVLSQEYLDELYSEFKVLITPSTIIPKNLRLIIC
ncbi:hypothetical protein [Xylocopilactobacillus apis]|uniref:Uncharacterized protein n=1 Tax=Xylocopilactobacillus apis TaxID=2932183 RepID=A0AAU9DCL9_9LACO|nr:hypothetical protein [Xylocopilactobacillus apis]BDR55891.1 hypothetical protein KIMC2_04530 [Xylocopilactobacillus apis]